MMAMNRSPLVVRNCICTDATHNRVKEVAKRTIVMAMGNVVANMRPKALEVAATLSMVAMVANWPTTNFANATKGEEQSLKNV